MKQPVFDQTNLRFRMSAGSLVLSIGSGNSNCELHDHWASDALRQVVECVALLAKRDRSECSSRWKLENDGHILDFAAWPGIQREQISVAIHVFPDAADVKTPSYFSAVRGPVVFEANYERIEFLGNWATQLWALYVLNADQFGFLPECNRLFPRAEFNRLYEGLRREYGFTLPSRQGGARASAKS